MAVKEADKKFINEAFTKLMHFAGVQSPVADIGLTELSQAAGNLSTDTSVVYWVDAVNGNDRGEGTEKRPFKTIMKALDSLPPVVLTQVEVFVKRGSYTEVIAPKNTVSNNGNISIRGVDWDIVVPSQGVNTGTFSARNRYTATVSGTPGWVANSLKGYFAEIVISGATYRIPIAGNTTNAIEFPFTVPDTYVNNTFKIVKPAQILYCPENETSCVEVSNSISGWGLGIEGFDINPNGIAYDAVSSYGGRIDLTECKVTATENSGISYSGFGGRISRCFVGGNMNSFGIATTATENSTYEIWIEGVCVDSHYIGIATWNINSLYIFTVSYQKIAGECMIQNCGDAINIADGSTRFTSEKFYIRNCDNGITVMGLLQGELGGVEIEDCAQNSIVFNGGELYMYGVGNNTLALRGGKILRSGQNGILIKSPYNCVKLIGAVEISNSGAFGINLLGDNGAAYNSVDVSSTVVMNANTSGDFNVTGAGATSLATLRAASNKVVLNANDFHRLKGF